MDVLKTYLQGQETLSVIKLYSILTKNVLYSDLTDSLIFGKSNDFYYYESHKFLWKRCFTKEELYHLLRLHIIEKIETIELSMKRRLEVITLVRDLDLNIDFEMFKCSTKADVLEKPNYHLIPIKANLVYNLNTNLIRRRTKEDYFTWETIEPVLHRDSKWRLFLSWLFHDPLKVLKIQNLLRISLSGNTKSRKICVLVGRRVKEMEYLFVFLQKLFHGMSLFFGEELLTQNLRSNQITEFCSKRLVFIRFFNKWSSVKNLEFLANGYYPQGSQLIDSTAKIFIYSEVEPKTTNYIEIIRVEPKTDCPIQSFTKEDFQDCLYWLLEEWQSSKD